MYQSFVPSVSIVIHVVAAAFARQVSLARWVGVVRVEAKEEDVTSMLVRLRVRLHVYLEKQRADREAREAQCRHDGTGPRCFACINYAHIYD